jgi:hypothetical protein
LNEYDPTSDQSVYKVSFSNAHDDETRVEYIRVGEMHEISELSQLIFWEITSTFAKIVHFLISAHNKKLR